MTDKPPVGGGQEIIEYDLDETAYFLEGTGIKRDDMTEQCPFCGETHTQEMIVCSVCNAAIVWHNSRTWKGLWGDSKKHLAFIKGLTLHAVTSLEIEFCRVFNHSAKFANAYQQKEFRKLAKRFPEGYMLELMHWGSGKGFSAYCSALHNRSNYVAWANKHGIILDKPEQEEEKRGDEEIGGWMGLAIERMKERE